jgi:uncharacterized lipoprotein YddW (UPF0748 family)
MGRIETRGVWLTNTDSQVLKSRENIARAMHFLAETGFNVVFPVVWNKAVTLYPSQVMQQNFAVEIDPLCIGRDPLSDVVTEARRVGLKVIPWFEYGFASSYNLNGGNLLRKKPEWAACNYEGKLLNKNGFEWMNALDHQVQQFLLDLVLEVVNNYDVDGIQGDDRFPALPSEGGYDRLTVERYLQEFGKKPPKNPQDKQWIEWRADILTNFLAHLHHEVKAVNPNLLISMAPNIHDWALKEYLQDSPKWLELGLVDIIHPQIYRRDFLSYKCIVDKLVSYQFGDVTLPKLAPGILLKLGSYLMNSELLLEVIEYNRACGIQGEVFFFYEGLRANDNALAKVLQKGPYAKSAVFPSLSDLNGISVQHKKSSSIWHKLMKLGRNIF